MNSLLKVVFTACLVLLVQDGKIWYKGNVAEAQNTVCELTNPSAESYVWKTPDFGTNDYELNFNCTFESTIAGPRLATYSLTSFELQDKARDKCRDKVRFYKPYDRNIKLCGTQTGKNFTVPMGLTYAEFVSNQRLGAPGFSISVTYSTDNTGIITMSSGGTSTYNLLSSNYPVKTADIAGEYWFETTEAGKEIQVDIDLDNKKTRCCRKDYVVVNPKGEALYPKGSSRIFCGIKRTTVNSKGQKLYIAYRCHHRAKFNMTISLI